MREESMTERINIKLQSVQKHEGESYCQLIAEYVPREPGRAARVTHFVREGEAIDLAVPPPEMSTLASEDRDFLDAKSRPNRSSPNETTTYLDPETGKVVSSPDFEEHGYPDPTGYSPDLTGYSEGMADGAEEEGG